MPGFGVIRGGRMDGWRYAFLGFVVDGPAVRVRCRVTPPAWPFGRDVVLMPGYALRLDAVAGERAPRLHALPLIRAAIEAAKAGRN